MSKRRIHTSVATWGADERADKVAILCPGPSLGSFADRDGYDCRIGVNRAAGAFLCDYWVALDVHTAGMTEPMGSPVIVNRENIHRRMCREHPYVKRLQHLNYTRLSFRTDDKRKIHWGRFSATVALVLAANLSAKQVDCFGIDWRGEEDFDGFTFIKNRRSDRRWQREQQLWRQVCKTLSSKGAVIRRIGTECDAGGKTA